MFGAVVKSYYAKKLGKKAEDMYVVSIMPCTAKKTECARPELSNDGVPNVDAVLTTRELGDLIKTMGINFRSLPDEKFDDPLGFSTGAADIFGVTGARCMRSSPAGSCPSPTFTCPPLWAWSR